MVFPDELTVSVDTVQKGIAIDPKAPPPSAGTELSPRLVSSHYGAHYNSNRTKC